MKKILLTLLMLPTLGFADIRSRLEVIEKEVIFLECYLNEHEDDIDDHTVCFFEGVLSGMKESLYILRYRGSNG